MAHLKFYFGHNGEELTFDSIVCEDGETPDEPLHFLKWYEKGDFETRMNNKEVTQMLAKSDSPIFATMFSPMKVTFDVDKLIEQRRARCDEPA